MINIILIAAVAVALAWLVMRYFPAVRFHAQRLMQNPFVRALILKGIWRLILRR